ncbi:hypothetical protein NicSoilE8_40830 (plasmid) [Arthrobacter sp. NicSoilE8]|nr:hypothetical protein NicSoilE8_40830 [Arthrobacter sp. NicSoilE8]
MHPELGTGLDHLWDSKAGALDRVERHEHGADRISDQDRDNRGRQVETIDSWAQDAGNERKGHDLHTEPD